MAKQAKNRARNAARNLGSGGARKTADRTMNREARIRRGAGAALEAARSARGRKKKRGNDY